PDEPDSRPILSGIGILHRKFQTALFQGIDRVPDDFFMRGSPGGFGILDDFQTAFGKLWIKRQPAVANRANIQVSGMTLREIRLQAFFLRQYVDIREFFLVTPLVTVDVVPAWRVLKAGRSLPVLGKCDGCPRLSCGEFFLADIVSQPPAIGADASGKHQGMDGRAVNQVGMVPMVGARPDNDRTLAAGLFGGVSPFSG